ncbi:hypothetical protein [Streptomyces sp. NPDC005281]|uniref:hypothetical protein n=1 Tax=Streptomyces sp. NPDC005281 TaxID=3155712 RepID=UPI0033B22592
MGLRRVTSALHYFVLNGTDLRAHGEQNSVVASYIRWRDTRAEPKTTFAPDSSIRTWTQSPTRTA